MGNLTELDAQNLTSFFAALIRETQNRVRMDREAFRLECKRMENSAALSAFKGKYDETDGWKAFASDDFIKIVEDLSILAGEDITTSKTDLLRLTSSQLLPKT